MSEYSAVIARGLNLPPAEVELILHASRMHDVGKIAVPESILRKPSALDPQEWTVMRQHSAIGSRILDNSSSQILQAGRVIALHHHERWDGAGYPTGLSGSDIPLWGRICAVADVFDAVTSERPYKPAFPNEEALQLLRDGTGQALRPARRRRVLRMPGRHPGDSGQSSKMKSEKIEDRRSGRVVDLEVTI